MCNPVDPHCIFEQEDPVSAVVDDQGGADGGGGESEAGQVRVRPDGQDGHREGGEEGGATPGTTVSDGAACKH